MSNLRRHLRCTDNGSRCKFYSRLRESQDNIQFVPWLSQGRNFLNAHAANLPMLQMRPKRIREIRPHLHLGQVQVFALFAFQIGQSVIRDVLQRRMDDDLCADATIPAVTIQVRQTFETADHTIIQPIKPASFFFFLRKIHRQHISSGGIPCLRKNNPCAARSAIV
ncbi:MAG: hypothetical protein HFACDABA_00324 [Anaerolineales bacterium]|nr:hypothetical protein [Anaerolineales bacterium]